MAGARAAVLVVPAAIYVLSYVHRIAPAVVATDLMQAFAISAASLGALAAIYSYVFVVMAFVGGSLVETLGPRLTLTTGATTMAMGLTASGLILVWSCVREVNNPAHVGIVIGICNAPIFLALALLQWLTGAILDAKWAGLAAGGVRIYPEAGYRAAFVVCLAVAAGSLVSTLFVTETRCRNIWKRAAH